MIVANSRKKSPVTYSEVPPFFSLVDYRNNYFASDDPKKIMEFYDSFENKEQLIQWMKERQKGVSNIHKVDGDKDVIVVIPTADFNGKYASNCRDNIFKGLHIIFVEEGGRKDFYFNLFETSPAMDTISEEALKKVFVTAIIFLVLTE